MNVGYAALGLFIGVLLVAWLALSLLRGEKAGREKKE